MIKVVYFNQWFSSIGKVIDDIRKKHEDEVKIIASSKNKNHVYKKYVDLFIEEDWIEGKTHEETMVNYIDWLLNICSKYKVDYFFCKKYSKYIVENKLRFNTLGVHIICDNIDIQNMFSSKAEVYDVINNNRDIMGLTSLIDILPEYHIFNEYTVQDALNYIEQHADSGDICLKLDSDEGGTSFRRIKKARLGIDSLHEPMDYRITPEQAEELVFESGSKLSDILFMELLSGPEISADCYNSKNGLITICRSKQADRVQKVYYDEKIYSICNDLCKLFEFKFPFNVQFRYSDGVLKLLEINTRMSGGLYYEVECGLNIAEVCLLDSMNKQMEYTIDKFINFKPFYVTHIEEAVILDTDEATLESQSSSLSTIDSLEKKIEHLKKRNK